jgi:hypothetical protein
LHVSVLYIQAGYIGLSLAPRDVGRIISAQNSCRK